MIKDCPQRSTLSSFATQSVIIGTGTHGPQTFLDIKRLVNFELTREYGDIKFVIQRPYFEKMSFKIEF